MNPVLRFMRPPTYPLSCPLRETLAQWKSGCQGSSLEGGTGGGRTVVMLGGKDTSPRSSSCRGAKALGGTRTPLPCSVSISPLTIRYIYRLDVFAVAPFDMPKDAPSDPIAHYLVAVTITVDRLPGLRFSGHLSPGQLDQALGHGAINDDGVVGFIRDTQKGPFAIFLSCVVLVDLTDPALEYVHTEPLLIRRHRNTL